MDEKKIKVITTKKKDYDLVEENEKKITLSSVYSEVCRL